jgi:hypothetical protein
LGQRAAELFGVELHMNEMDEEFLPLPNYTWDQRPSIMPLDVEECATALYLVGGVLEDAAERLRIHPLRLVRFIARHKRLQRLHAELSALLHDKVHKEYRNAFDSEDDRRREWAASKVAQTRAFQEHPLAPNANASSSSPGLALNGVPNRIVISWDDGPALPSPEAPLIEHDPHE